MTKLLTCVLLLTLANEVHSQDMPDKVTDRPLLSDYIRGTFVGQILDLTCSIKIILADREVSDRIYKIGDDLNGLVRNGLDCGSPIILEAVNNLTSPLGLIVSAFRMIQGYRGKVTRLSDLVSVIPVVPILVPFLFLGGLNWALEALARMGALRQLDFILQQIQQTCLGNSVDEIKKEVVLLLHRLGNIYNP